MATTDSSDAPQIEWDGYTDYQQVAGRYASEIHDATAAAAMLQRIGADGGQFAPREVAEASSRILSAALLLEEQMRLYEHTNDKYSEILDEWTGEEGRIEQMRRTDMLAGAPDWLFDFVREINRAGLELGYLKAGREEEIKDEGDTLDSEVRDVIEEMTL